MPKVKFLFTLCLLCSFFTACSQTDRQNQVVVYTSVDQVYSSAILQRFEKETGIEVKAVYDAEASKGVGLEKRLLAETQQPVADVFWNSEVMRTARLAQQGVFSPYEGNTNRYPGKNFVAGDKTWHGFGARSRVIIVNTDLVEPHDYPLALEELTEPRFFGKIAISSPFAGSTSTHFAALLDRIGEAKLVRFLTGLKANNVALLAGNSVVKDAVGHGKYAIGIVDTDDALVGIEQGLPLKMLYYNQSGDGVYSFFQTVALVKNGPNPTNGARLMDFLLNEKTEAELIKLKAVQFPLLSAPAAGEVPRMWASVPEDIVTSFPLSVALLRAHLE